MTQDLKLITKRACPFAQRTRIVLNLLKLAPEIIEVDVYDKPEWFGAISPLGKVPVLVHKGAALFESTAINEYLVEVFGAHSGLVSADPVERARMRAWIQFDETALAPAFYRLLLEQDPAAQVGRRAVYEDRLGVLETHLAADPGPFLLGARPTLGDITLYTHLTRLPLLQRERDVGGRSAESALMRWMGAIAALPGVLSAAPSEADLEDDLAPYITGAVAGTTALDMAGKQS